MSSLVLLNISIRSNIFDIPSSWVQNWVCWACWAFENWENWACIWACILANIAGTDSEADAVDVDAIGWSVLWGSGGGMVRTTFSGAGDCWDWKDDGASDECLYLVFSFWPFLPTAFRVSNCAPRTLCHCWKDGCRWSKSSTVFKNVVTSLSKVGRSTAQSIL